MKQKLTLVIKNMVCPRCITAVNNVFSGLKLEIDSIKLGEVQLLSPIDDKIKAKLKNQLKESGFELLEDSNSQIIAKIKSLIIDYVHQNTKVLDVNFSDYLSQQLNRDYYSLSKLFSSVVGLTIEKFIVKQKIEKVKELLFYKELTLSEIAYTLNYSSSAHLSNQFKKETGMTPSSFKKMKHPSHQSLDSI